MQFDVVITHTHEKAVIRKNSSNSYSIAMAFTYKHAAENNMQ